MSQGRVLAEVIPEVAVKLSAGRLPAGPGKVMADRLGDETAAV